LLSIFTLGALPVAVIHARRHNVVGHRKAMIGIFTGALVIAGIFTFWPGRIMYEVVTGIERCFGHAWGRNFEPRSRRRSGSKNAFAS
jgi:hypothetical protein